MVLGFVAGQEMKRAVLVIVSVFPPLALHWLKSRNLVALVKVQQSAAAVADDVVVK